ncbi:ribosomal maturation YjgA family protein [Thiothrix lacustris]|uniref:ribosomal maturation YjgA family protein n=1 Tax=Thiothrix lacustris TaxID=525917 RepID=UPI00048BBE61|nr:DUF2809 domain-containing protein [Thiothrix lacustris]WMP16430.1 DUF2809 domain-containing protein [Thiothrix lacustris]
MRLNLPMLAAAIILFIVEVIIATKLNDYHFIRAYFGDFLVVILLYCAAKAVYDFEPKRLAIGVFAFATLIEVAQLFRLADVLHLTGWARVVLGTSFSFHDLLMYAAGCIAVYWLDTRIGLKLRLEYLKQR